MDGMVQGLGQWDRNIAGRRQNDPERTGRKRKSASSESWCQEYLFLPWIIRPDEIIYVRRHHCGG